MSEKDPRDPFVDRLRSLVNGDIGKEIRSFETLDSTNRVAMDLAEQGAVHGTVVIARSQTQGRGRLSRRWVSPPGENIYLSIIMRPAVRPKDTTLLTVIAAVACCRALRDETGLDIAIKWPNDLTVSDRKLGGILTEAKSGTGVVVYAVIGIGVNVSATRDDFPPELREIATSVAIEKRQDFPRAPIIAAILREMECWYSLFLREGRHPLLTTWKSLTSTLGRTVHVTCGEESFTGRAEGIDQDGMLLVRLPSGTIRTVRTGDLTFIR